MSDEPDKDEEVEGDPAEAVVGEAVSVPDGAAEVGATPEEAPEVSVVAAVESSPVAESDEESGEEIEEESGEELDEAVDAADSHAPEDAATEPEPDALAAVETEPAEEPSAVSESPEPAEPVEAASAEAGLAGEAPAESGAADEAAAEEPAVEDEPVADEPVEAVAMESASIDDGAVALGAGLGGGAAAAQSSIQYAKRNTRFDKQDCGWWVDGDYLFETDGRGREWRTHLGDVLEVQTAPAPARFRPWRHQTVLGLRNSRRIEIDNAHYVGTANYEERSGQYAPFVRDLIGVVAERAPYAKARRGASYLGYVAMLAFVVVLIGLVATLLFLLPIEGVAGIVWIKAGLVALMAPPLFAWVVKSRPSGVPLAELPPGALPRAKP